MKKILSITLVVVLLAGMAVTGTMAYLQDSDSDVNVMTLGNVQIEQIEEQRVDTTKAGNLTEDDIEDFKQGKPLLPYVDTNINNAMRDDYEEVTFPNGKTNKLFIGDNAIDKLVAVKNTGKSDAYVRTIIALEAPTDKIDLSFNSTDWAMDKTASSYSIEVNGVKYDLFVAIYKSMLKPGETTPYSLMQIILDWTATNEDAVAYGDTYDVLVLSQAVQAEGFEATANKSAAQVALDTAFGVVNSESAAEWFGGMKVPVLVETAEKLEAALAEGSSVVLCKDIELTNAVIVEKFADINLNGWKLTTKGLELKSGADIENGTITSGGNTNLIPHLKVSGGKLTMDNVTVDVQHHLNANANWSEASGMEVAGATAVLNNCHIKIHNSTHAKWVYSYGLSLNGATATMNGGSITATCVAGTAANGPTNPNAISTMGECTATLNNVDVNAYYYGTTVNGHFTLNTTDKAITSANIVDNRGGSHTINYID